MGNSTQGMPAWLTQLLEDSSPGQTLRDWYEGGFLQDVAPEISALYGVPQNPEHHPEVCTGLHTELCLDMAVRLQLSPAARFAVLVHDLGKALTPPEEWPRHIDHEMRGIVPVRKFALRVGVPQHWRRLALTVCEFHLDMHRVFEMRSKSVLKLLSASGLEFDERLMHEFAGACEADKRGRLHKTEKPYDQRPFVLEVRAALQEIPLPQGLTPGDRLAQQQHKHRLDAVRAIRDKYRPAQVDRQEC